MRLAGIEIKRRVWVALLGAVTSVAVWWLWTASKIPVVAEKPPVRQPAVRLATTEISPSDNILRERAEYMDPTPLFFPTEWNFGQKALREGMKREPGQIFDWEEAQFVFKDQAIKSYSSDTRVIPSHLADVVGSGNEAPLAGMGESDLKPVVLAERAGFLEVRDLRDGKTIIAQVVAQIPGIRSDFTPVEFLVAVSSEGLVADPVLMTGSGREETEIFLRTYLAKSFRVGERLAPGMYRILIGP